MTLLRTRREQDRLDGFETLEDRLLLSGSNAYWELLDTMPANKGAESYLRAKEFAPYTLDSQQIEAVLTTAPIEYSAASQPLITLPTPDGGFEQFTVNESPIMEPELAAQFPEIKTYSGQGIDNRAATLRLDATPAGLHAQVLSPTGSYYIDPYYHLNDSVYASYFAASEADVPTFHEFGVEEYNAPPSSKQAGQREQRNAIGPAARGDEPLARSGAELRTYRAAVAATGEYTAFHGGTVAMGQAAIVTAMNRVTGIYEKELSIRLTLVANNSSLVYTNAGTDPYTNSSASLLLSENQANIDAVIGNANYDIGHVFSTDGGGLAGLGVVGETGQKARGETGLSNPVGDNFYVDYVAHEMGHQFDGNHTFNGDSGSCAGGNRNAGTAYEPGSGSTIQAYAGICGNDDLQDNSDPYFHSISFDEIINYVDNVIPAVGTRTATGNSIPTVDAGSDYTIPAATPFVLTASGSDGNGDTLTYNWEQRDLGPRQDVNAGDNGSSPIFRSFLPTEDPSRVFPRLDELLTNTTVIGETLPTTDRTLNFRATVRDNRAGCGGVNTDDMVITVVDTGSPFEVTSPNTAVTWQGNEQQTITWNVADTNAAPINVANVNILLSTDSGQTFDTILASNTPNDGEQLITLPNIETFDARIKVEAVGNIFFDISNADFSIIDDPDCTSVDAHGYQACAVPYAFEDISASGTAIAFSNLDDGTAELTDALLGGFEFQYYDSTYNNLFVSTNGLLSFGSANSAWGNTDLTAESQAIIAPFWDDLRDDAGEAYWEIKGGGERERLIIQWDQWDYFGGSANGAITFQAILNEYDRSIRFNYADLADSGDSQTEGAEATVGIKDAGTQGGDRLLISQDSGPNLFVGSGVSVLIKDHTVAVFDGTSGDDVFVLDASGGNFVAKVNSAQSTLNSNLVKEIKFSGLGGDDSIKFTGGAGNKTATLRVGSLLVESSKYIVSANSTETIRVSAGTGFDQADLFDSTGNDRFYGRSGYSYLTGTDFFNRVEGFDKVYANANAGDAGGVGDRAYLYDSTGNERFYGRPIFSYLTGNGFYNQARNFDKVYAYATEGDDGGVGDRAYMYDSTGNDTFVGRPTHSYLTGTDFYYRANRFDRVYAYATAGNNGGVGDRARLYDSSGNDKFYGRPTYSYITGSDFFNRANGFDNVYAYANAGDLGGIGDRAFVYDSTGNETFYGRNSYGRLIGNGFLIYARGFDRISAYANEGGIDTINNRSLSYDFFSYGDWEKII